MHPPESPEEVLRARVIGEIPYLACCGVGSHAAACLGSLCTAFIFTPYAFGWPTAVFPFLAIGAVAVLVSLPGLHVFALLIGGWLARCLTGRIRYNRPFFFAVTGGMLAVGLFFIGLLCLWACDAVHLVSADDLVLAGRLLSSLFAYGAIAGFFTACHVNHLERMHLHAHRETALSGGSPIG